MSALPRGESSASSDQFGEVRTGDPLVACLFLKLGRRTGPACSDPLGVRAAPDFWRIAKSRIASAVSFFFDESLPGFLGRSTEAVLDVEDLPIRIRDDRAKVLLD